jgi:threonyl-tRNA synthetase
VDFNLPERFDLTYIDSDGAKKRPFVIHRALIGSFERFFAFLIEHYAGAFPLWLSPVQVKIISVGQSHIEYARKLSKELQLAAIRASVDDSDETVGNKIRKAIGEKAPYIIVIGDKEIESDKLAIRDRGAKETRLLDKQEFVAEVLEKIKNKS